MSQDTMRLAWRLTSIILGVCIISYWSSITWHSARHWIDTFIWNSPSHEPEDHQAERGCFQGNSAPPGVDKIVESIPRVVHFIYGLQDPELSFLAYLAIRSALVSLQPTKLKLHYSFLNEDNVWYKKLAHSITLVFHNPESELHGKARNKWKVAHLADVLRLDILQREGGIYLDSDVLSLRSFDTILSGTKDVIMGHEGRTRYGLCNAVIVARRNATFINRWIDNYDTFDESNWNYHSVILPKEMEQEFRDEICPLSPTSFFWPMYTGRHVNYMHKELSSGETLKVEQTLQQYSGALYHNQLAYHAWSQLAWEPYLSKLTPELIMTKNTRFNLMIRRFLE